MNRLRMSIMRVLPVFVFMVALSLAGCSDQTSTSGGTEKPGAAEAAQGPHWADDVPRLSVAGLEALIEQNRGKTVFLCFWSVNCPACLDELPVLEKLADSFDPDKLAMVLVNLDGKPSVLKQYFQDYTPISQVVFAEEDVPGHFRAVYIPKLVLYSASGKVSFEDSGFYPEKMLEALIHKAFKE